MTGTKKFWNFPSARGIQKESINDPGIETFKDHPLNSLAREICQNSLDACDNHEKPVLIKFDRFSIDTSDFPGIEVFKKNHEYAEETWSGNNQALEYLGKAKSILEEKNINFLKISDFNTKGLIGAESNDLGSPWSTLVKEVGSSNKSDTSGGSFGIGKFAPFANSDIRTVFYSTHIPKGNFYIGVSKFMSFDTSNNETTTGVGYFSSSEDSHSINEDIPFIENQRANKYGTDIFIAGFNKDDSWSSEIIKSVINNFFVTIWKGKLTVSVDGVIVDVNNLQHFIDKFGDDDTKGYYEVLTSEDTIKLDVVEHSKILGEPYGPEFGYKENDATLYLLKSDSGNRRILMTRSTGMTLFEQKNISSSIFFSGILMIEGEKMNSDFKKMENPAHNEWSHERYLEDPRKAKRMYDNLRKFNRTAVIEKFQETTGDEMDATGLNDFLPDDYSENIGGKKKVEIFETNFSGYKIKKKIKQKENLSKEEEEGKDEKKIKELIDVIGDPIDGETGGGLDQETDGSSTGASQPGAGSGDLDVDKNPEGDIFRKYQEVKGKTIDVTHKVAVSKNDGEYIIIMNSSQELNNTVIEVLTIGEVRDEKPEVTMAKLNDTVLNVKKNMIHLPLLNKGEITELKFKINFNGLARIGVEFFEVKR